MLQKAYKRYKKKVGPDFSMVEIVRAVKRPYGTVYNLLMYGRTCHAQIFLDLMAFFGCKSIEGDKLDEAKF